MILNKTVSVGKSSCIILQESGIICMIQIAFFYIYDMKASFTSHLPASIKITII